MHEPNRLLRQWPLIYRASVEPSLRRLWLAITLFGSIAAPLYTLLFTAVVYWTELPDALVTEETVRWYDLPLVVLWGPIYLAYPAICYGFGLMWGWGVSCLMRSAPAALLPRRVLPHAAFLATVTYVPIAVFAIAGDLQKGLFGLVSGWQSQPIFGYGVASAAILCLLATLGLAAGVFAAGLRHNWSRLVVLLAPIGIVYPIAQTTSGIPKWAFHVDRLHAGPYVAVATITLAILWIVIVRRLRTAGTNQTEAGVDLGLFASPKSMPSAKQSAWGALATPAAARSPKSAPSFDLMRTLRDLPPLPTMPSLILVSVSAAALLTLVTLRQDQLRLSSLAATLWPFLIICLIVFAALRGIAIVDGWRIAAATLPRLATLPLSAGELQRGVRATIVRQLIPSAAVVAIVLMTVRATATSLPLKELTEIMLGLTIPFTLVICRVALVRTRRRLFDWGSLGIALLLNGAATLTIEAIDSTPMPPSKFTMLSIAWGVAVLAAVAAFVIEFRRWGNPDTIVGQPVRQ